MFKIVLFLSYPLLGCLTGIVSGLFGLGGGLLIVPALSFLLPLQGFPRSDIMHTAIATSLAVVTVVSLSAVYAHHRRQAVQWSLLKFLGPGAVLGGVSGALLASHLSGRVLELLFGVFSVAIALKMLLNVTIAGVQALPSRPVLMCMMMFMSMLCSMLGLTGGVLLVPYLQRYRILMTHAVATAAVCNGLVAFSGIVTFTVAGLVQHKGWFAQMNVVYGPAFLGIALTSVLTASLGVRWAHQLPQERTQHYFALILLVVALKMILPH